MKMSGNPEHYYAPNEQKSADQLLDLVAHECRKSSEQLDRLRNHFLFKF